MSKVLIITPACHFTNIGAAQRDIYAAVKLLKKMGFEVAMYTIDSVFQSQEVLQKISVKFGIEIKKFLPVKKIKKRFSCLLRMPSLFDGGAFVFDELINNKDFIGFVKEWQPDFIFSFCSYSWPVLKFARQHRIKSVFRSHNFESSFFWESLGVAEKLNPLNWLRVLAKYRGEYLATTYADKVGTLPFAQVNIYQKWKASGIEILTLFFLPESLRRPNIHSDKKCLDLFYLGASYNVIFHRRGAALLINDIAPKVLTRAPGRFKFHICGSKLPPSLASKCKGNLIYEDYVADLEFFLQGMDAGVFPVMTGRTMKGKVFETLARAFPMVIPNNCLGGYFLRDETEVLIANNVEQFVEKILQLQDEKIRTKLSNNAYIFSEREFGEQKIISTLSGLLSG